LFSSRLVEAHVLEQDDFAGSHVTPQPFALEADLAAQHLGKLAHGASENSSAGRPLADARGGDNQQHAGRPCVPASRVGTMADAWRRW